MPPHLPRHFTSFESAWRAPSNIAIVKYWGKQEVQRPANSNFSFTLKHCQTSTRVRFTRRIPEQKASQVWFHGRPHPRFLPKIELFLKRAERHCPWISQLHLHIETANSFPHGAGLASSASAMAALGLCLSQFQRQFFDPEQTQAEFLEWASFLARLGSGSACRSIFAPAATWGVEEEHRASPFENLHPTFRHLQDAILIVGESEKPLSSSEGHAQMQGHPFARARYHQAERHWQQLAQVLRSGEFTAFARICEAEAHALHAMISTAPGGAVLWHPQSLAVMNKIAGKRQEGLPVCYTLDAGPNVHLLFPREYRRPVHAFVESELLPLLPTGRWIDDEVGPGPQAWNS